MAFLLLAGTILIFSSCTGGKLPENVDKETVISQAKEIVTQISNRDFEAVVEKFDSKMKKAIDADGLRQSFGARLDELGTFQSYQSESATGGSEDTIGEYSIIILICNYENGKAVYTISLDVDGKICGLYMK